ncbi:hypothetical protein NDU88_001602 [Pleurodeles waltl]|uniref:Uncharacterized protein n=1 Tax=Pleurodeles waltl TaxID=8319 RepID=A0AAV7S7T6_PLEWA|nr:hypothetical protein NDU88_001602 [Pleurodeles waltl]
MASLRTWPEEGEIFSIFPERRSASWHLTCSKSDFLRRQRSIHQRSDRLKSYLLFVRTVSGFTLHRSPQLKPLSPRGLQLYPTVVNPTVASTRAEPIPRAVVGCWGRCCAGGRPRSAQGAKSHTLEEQGRITYLGREKRLLLVRVSSVPDRLLPPSHPPGMRTPLLRADPAVHGSPAGPGSSLPSGGGSPALLSRVRTQLPGDSITQVHTGHLPRADSLNSIPKCRILSSSPHWAGSLAQHPRCSALPPPFRSVPGPGRPCRSAHLVPPTGGGAPAIREEEPTCTALRRIETQLYRLVRKM